MKQSLTKEQLPYIKKKYNIKGHLLLRSDGTIDVNGNVTITNTKLKKLPLKFGKVYGDFICCGNELTTLKNAPTYVGRNFNCYNNKLKNLVGAPTYVGGDFICHENELETLEGCPLEINGNFSCFLNNLTSLVAGPEKIKGNAYIHHNRLLTLVGGPSLVEGSLFASSNFLENLIGCPGKIGKIFSFDDNVKLDMGYRNCSAGEVKIEVSDFTKQNYIRLPYTVRKNEKYLHTVFEFMEYLPFYLNDVFDEKLFLDMILDINDGFK
ncbi:hypothetical protein HNP99_001629 [Flavobacterium sp. 28A]|uniref:hypothetical protein n=1 Tax=Flavobacterium sp. 28A TaxID=2735895 RepID=UPI00156DDA75|nr:hypothetical protein [Flavobacterium sp. 28A]NRT15282.1 hypothetical protein [Flavobacterium sp. 28A]